MSSPSPNIVVEPMRARERSAAELRALFTDGWPAFIDADEVTRRQLPTVRVVFGDLEVAVLQDGVLSAAGWGVPISWDGTEADLPGGYSDALTRAVDGYRHGRLPDTLVICAAQVRSDVTGSGLAARVVEGLIERAEQAQLPRVIAPLRPTLKHRYPLVPIESYAAWTRADGGAFDPWLRLHLRMGARVVGTSTASQTFTGTVRQWEQWGGLELPGDGTYLVPDALAPVEVDRSADLGTCTEPAIWVQHR